MALARPPHDAAPPARLGVVNGLRGVAILAVLWHHLHALPPCFRAPVVAGVPLPLFAFFSNGWLGVNLFLVLSGLVLYLPYARGERELADARDARDFYRRRARRLLPLHYLHLAFVFVFVVHPKLDVPGALEVLRVLTFTNVFTKAEYAPRFNGPLWSLGVEVWLSVLFPLLALAIRRFGLRRVLVASAAIALVVRIAGVLVPAVIRPHNPYLNPLKDSALGRLDELVLGMLLAELVARGASLAGTRAARRATWLAPLGLLLFWAGCAGWDLRATGRVPPMVAPFLNLLVDGGVFAMTAAAIGSRGVLGRVLAHPLLQVPGKMCYSLYVWHGVLIKVMLGPDYDAPRLLLYLVALAAVAALSFRFVELRHEKDWRVAFRADP